MEDRNRTSRSSIFDPPFSMAVAMASVLAALILLPSLTYPLGPDDSAYAYVARRLLQGDVLYRDLYESKLGIYFLYASVFRLFGDTTLALRAFDLAWQVVTAGFVVALSAEVMDLRRAAIAGVLYTLFYMDTNFWSMASADSFLNLPSLIALLAWVHCRKRGELSWAVWAGLGLGAAMLLRPTAGVLVLMLPVVWCTTAPLPHGRSSGFARAMLVTLLAAAFTFAPFAVYFTVHNAWADFRTTWLVMNPFYATQIGFDSWREALVSITRQFQNTAWMESRLELVVIVFGPLFALTQLRTNRGLWLPLGYLFVGMLGLVVQRKFFVYQWSPLYPPLAMLGAKLFEVGKLVAIVPAERRRRFEFIGTGAALFFIISCLFVQARNYDESFARPTKAHFVGEGFSYPIELEVATHLRGNTAPDDTICIWGFSPALHWLSRRNAATGRIFYSHVLQWPAMPKAWRDDYLTKLFGSRPKFIVLRRNDVMPQLTGRTDDSWMQFYAVAELRQFLDAEYQFDRMMGDPNTPEYYGVYRRRATQ